MLMNTIKCPNCQTEIESTYEFCPKCGASLKKESSVAIESPSKVEPISASVLPSKEKYSTGIKATLVWSVSLSLITILFFTFKGLSNLDFVVKILFQGLFARPLSVLLISFIISIIFKPKEKQISRFNSSSIFIMAILSARELFHWFVDSY